MADKVKALDTSKGKIFKFHCPGCKVEHAVDSGWAFNGNFEKPTFSPSVLYREFDDSKEVHPKGIYVCHFYVRDGMIEYLGDCDHELKNQKVPMKDLNG